MIHYHWRVSLLREHIEQSIRSQRFFRRGQPILVAVSGGLDSMVLLHVLHDLAPRNGWRLTVAHLNHQLRGRSSDADERLVRQTAQKLKLPIRVKRACVRQFARKHKLSIEMAARSVRHDFLARAAARLRIPSIALAHHADDQLEHFFLRLLRGSGGEGLAGMLWRSPSPADPAIELARPLLDLPKSALGAFAAEMQIRFREDATNALLDIQRNRIRHELLPLLRSKYQPALDRTVLRSMEIIGAEAEFVTQAALDWLCHQRPSLKLVGVDARKVWSFRTSGSTEVPLRYVPRLGAVPYGHLPVAVQRRCVQLQLMRLGVIPDFDLVERLRTNATKPVSIGESRAGVSPAPAGLLPPNDSAVHPKPKQRFQNTGRTPGRPYVLRDRNGVVLLQQARQAVFRAASLEVCLGNKAGQVAFGGAGISWRIGSQRPIGRVKPAAGREFFDADAIGSHILLRHWQRGDRFQPIGMKCAVKLQDFFTNQKVPRARRHKLIVALTAKGEVFWVEGMRIAERFKLTRQTIRRLQWRWQRL